MSSARSRGTGDTPYKAHTTVQGPNISLDFGQLANIHDRIAVAYRHLGQELENRLAEAGKQSDMCCMPNAPHPGLKQMLTVADLAHVLQVDESTIRRWHRSGKLPRAVAIGKLLRWDGGAFDDWLQAQEGAV